FTDIGIEAGCAFSVDGKPQAGMGVAAGDYDRDGWLDIFKTNFSGDTSSLYRNIGKGMFDDVTFPAGIGVNTRWLGWGCGFLDVDNDGWSDIFLVNGHVYPEVEKLTTEAGYAQRKVLYHNLRNGRFSDVSEKVGEAITRPNASRGAAFGDYDNDGDIDILINSVNGLPELLRANSSHQNNWLKIKTIGVKSNRNGIGVRIKCITEDGTQIDEVRSGGSYYSQNDLRVHFGLGANQKVKTLEIQWPSGQTDSFRDIAANQLIVVKEKVGITRATKAPEVK
ncbi:MAG: CRTAC1 family protein, partial [Pyrinomonadaceae bacterium]